MTELPYYPEDYDRDYWMEYLLRLVEGNATDEQLTEAVRLASQAVNPWAKEKVAMDLLVEHRTEWQDYFHAKKELRQQLLKLFGGIPLN